MLGLAHKAGRVEIGEEPVGSAARARKARIILVASDAAAGSVRRAMSFANTGNCLCLVIPTTKNELGRALGRTSCAMAAVTDIGFADAVAKKLAALEPEKYESAAERMAVKAQRARERRQEQLNHERTCARGRKKRRSPRRRRKRAGRKRRKLPRRGAVRRSGKSPADPTAGRAAPPQGSGRRRRLVSGLRAAVR